MKKPLSPSVLEREIRHGLALPPEKCRSWLEDLSGEAGFSGFCWLWGPQLYRLDPVLFRPLILAHASSLRWRGGWNWVAVPWSSDLEQWLQLADERDDVAVCRLLLPWKLGSSVNFVYRALPQKANEELRRRLQSQPAGTARVHVELAKCDFWFALDEDTALLLYERLPSGCGSFLLKHLPGEAKVFWDRLFSRVLERDPRLAWGLYRRLIPVARWEKEVLELCTRIAAPQELIRELQLRTARQARGEVLARVLHRLLEARGAELFPYVIPRLQHVWRPMWGRGHFGKLLQLASKNHWLDLWAALLRICSTSKDWNQAVLQSLAPGGEGRLLALAGVAREWDFGGLGLRQVHLLDEPTALAMLELRPDMLRLVYPVHLQISPWHGGYVKLLRALVDGADFEDLFDMLASRFCLAPKGGPEVEFLADYYAANPSSRRKARVLGKVPAFAVWNYPALIRENRLARLLFERRVDDYLEDEEALTELVEANQIHVQALAYRCLARARPEMAASHLTLLLGTLLRPLQAHTRRLAIAALQRAGEHSLEVARRILEQARQARRIADRRYPRQQLLGLVGHLLHRWPELRQEREQPQVYAHV